MDNITKAYKTLTEAVDIDVSNDPEVVEAKNKAITRMETQDVDDVKRHLPSDNWYVKYDASNAQEIPKDEYDELKNQITGTAKHIVHHGYGTSATSWTTGNHFQNFLQSKLNKYEVFKPNRKHPDQSLPMIFKLTGLHTGTERHFKIDSKDLMTRDVK